MQCCTGLQLTYCATACFFIQRYNLKSIVGLYYCSRDTLKLKFAYLSGKIDIFSTHRNQKCYFKVISSALSNIRAFCFVFNLVRAGTGSKSH